jgi:hypothetical protein
MGTILYIYLSFDESRKYADVLQYNRSILGNIALFLKNILLKSTCFTLISQNQCR